MAELRFDDRVAVITGAGRGLGRAYALLLASRGARVVVNDTGTSRTGAGIEAGPAQEVVEEIKAAGGEAVACLESVASRQGGQVIIDTAIDRFGRIDILIHNAGINRQIPIKDMAWEDFSEILDVHLHGGFHLAKAALPHMYGAGYGRIVMTSSIAGLYGDKNLPAYCVSKAGLIGLANALALEGAAEGVTCNVIVPAAVTRLSEGRDTSAFPPMEPELVAPAVCWLAHESCKASGEIFVALAGRVAKAFVAETRGVYQPAWTIEGVADQLQAIGDAEGQVVFPPVPSGFYDHLSYSFAMAKGE